MPNQDGVYVGFWTDYDQSSPLRQRLTLPNQDAATLLAFLAIIVTIAAGSSWGLWRMILHMLGRPRRTGEPVRDSQRVILRTVSSDLSAVIRLVEVMFAEQTSLRKYPQPLRKLLPVLVIALVHWLSFLCAGIFTSKISLGNIVIGDGGANCGYYISPGMDESPPGTLPDDQLDWLDTLANNTVAAENYARNCYEAENIADCNRLASQRLEWRATHNASCPFAPGICLEGDNSALTLDTGHLPFSKLGINIASHYSFRRVMTCSPLNNAPFIYPKNLTSGEATGTPEQNRAYKLAPKVPLAYIYSPGTVNDINVTYLAISDTYSGYRLSHYPLDNDPNRATGPHAPLNPKGGEGDVTVIYLSMNGITFTKPSYDPFFSATFPAVDDRDGRTYYLKDYYATSLACVDQLQICNLDKNECGPLESIMNSSGWWPYDNKTVPFREKAATNLVRLSIIYSRVSEAIGRLGSRALRLMDNYERPYQLRVDREQWKTEVSHWFNTGLAQIQLNLLRTVHISPSLNKDHLTNPLNTTKSKDITCRLVKFHSIGYTSLSVFGIGFVVVFSAFLLILGLAEPLVLKLVGCVHPPLVEAWKNDDIFQFSKDANKGAGEYAAVPAHAGGSGGAAPGHGNPA
ncbi:hypothetical protein FGG08_000585 [Glutinoglossum americanum]|uniref:Uncharacterized protein n=1 Tax=Glutinoglossum americanum TaxID=1670608 RepID=A0A9P8IF13_9PEZI|nr:hypothetical protein FGG08_000585 [Glutinoglossum americanum]